MGHCKSWMGVKWMEGPLPYGTYSLVTTNKEQGIHCWKFTCTHSESLHTAIYFRACSDLEFISDILVISHEYSKKKLYIFEAGFQPMTLELLGAGSYQSAIPLWFLLVLLCHFLQLKM